MPPVKKVKQNADKPARAEIEVDAVVSGQLQKKIKKQKEKAENKRGVVFIKHLPHGFFEEQLKKYFQQFGSVTRLRLARSKRTGGSKGYAFVEFEYPEVAQVAAETMDNYLMFQRVVKASYIPPDMQRFNYFKSSLRKVKNKAGKEIYISGKTAAAQRKIKKQNDWSESAYQKRASKSLKKLEKLKVKYEHLGIDFSNIVIGPKLVQPAGKNEESRLKSTEMKADKSSTQKNKRKNVLEAASSSKIKKNTDKEVELKDLLGNTIPEDSEDEDYVISNDDVDENVTSDEESYGFLKDSDNDDDDDEQSDDHVEPSPVKGNKKFTLQKPTKPSKVDRFDQLIKRKPHTGGIQKPGKKSLHKPIVSKAKKSMQVAAVKEIAKTKAKVTPKIKAKSAGKQKR